MPNLHESVHSVNILAKSNVWNIQQNGRLPIDKLVENVLSQSRKVVFDFPVTSFIDGIVAVGENDRLYVQLILEHVAVMDVGNGNFVLSPHNCSRLCSFSNYSTALLNEVVVGEDQVIHQSSGTLALAHGSREQVD